MNITRKIRTTNRTPWRNTCEYIVLHHTGTGAWTTQGIINAFTGQRQVSAHLLINELDEIYQFWEFEDILWHAWKSTWDGRTNLNRYSIGIEVIWPLADWGFTDGQIRNTIECVKYLQAKYNIPNERVVRHLDISPWRKWDIADTFFRGESFEVWKKKNLQVTKTTMWEYENFFNTRYKWVSRVLNDIEWAIQKTGIARELLFLQLIMHERSIDAKGKK